MAASRFSLLLLVALCLHPIGPALAAQAYPPANVAVTQGKAGVTITWSMVKGRGVTYRVLRSASPKEPGQDLTKPMDWVPEGFVDQSGTQRGATYFYSVVAVYGPGVEAASAPVQFPLAAPVAAPLPMAVALPQTVALGPVATVPAPGPSTMPTPLPGSLPVTSRTGPPPPPAPGPPPGNVWVKGNPAEARVSWNAAYGASGYTVTRWSTTNPNCCRLQSAVLPATATTYDDLVQWPGTYAFRVTAIYPPDAANPGGRQGFADAPAYVYPEPYVPRGFEGKRLADGSIKFTWDLVEHASAYIFSGPPTNTPVRVNTWTPTITVPPPAATGTLTWRLSTVYDAPSGAQSRAGSAFVTTTVTIPATGKYRVVAQMIQVTKTTGDTPPPEQVLGPSGLKNDGPGDEVFLTSLAQTIKRSDRSLIQTFPIMVSAVHGDVATWPQDNRARSGTASGWGGLKAGDVIAPVYGPGAGSSWPMFVLWEGTLTDGTDDLVIHPVLWDADQANQELSRIVGSCSYSPQCSASRVEGWARSVVNGGSSPSTLTAALQAAQITVAPGTWLWASGPRFTRLEQQASDRPIGLTDDGSGGQNEGISGRWFDVQVVMSREKIEAALGSGNNVINVRMMDRKLVNGTEVYHPVMGGDYTLVLRVERAP